LANATNNFVGAVNAIGLNINLLDGSGGINLGNVSATGALNVTSRAGTITQAAVSTVAVSGATTLTADNGLLAPSNIRYGIALANASNNFTGAVTANGTAITLKDVDALTVVLNGTGSATLAAAVALNVSGTLSGALSNLTTVTTGLTGTTTFGATTVDGALKVSSSGAVKRTIACHGDHGSRCVDYPTTVNPKVTVNGVVGALIP